jgi:hypothetical protein
MKKLLLVVVLISSLICLSSCVPEQYYKNQERFKVDEEYAKELGAYIKTDTERKALANGDSYCEACDKAIAGKVRICTYCGQYL